ncbi:MAG TPA: WbqC family protein [Burkholderiales bacterium]|nr:WbqC family protein [Burkholderiales bacterium]
MIVAIHQPHFLPWLGLLDRMARVDLFVLLDHVQFERRNYQNRTRIRLGGGSRWLTVPVEQRSQKERIVDKLVDNRPESRRGWGEAHYKTLRHAYREAPFIRHYAPALRRLLIARWERLVDLNQAALEFLREEFAIRTPLLTSSALGVAGARGELILNVCRAVGADRLLAGMGGSRGYLDVQGFARAGVRVQFHDYRHPAYTQCGAGPFIPGLSAIDLLLNCGPQSRGLLCGAGAARELLAAA